MSTNSSNLAEEAIVITKEYLGPAAGRFINKQISFHLEKDPADLTPQDIPKLVEWVNISLALLTEDKRMVEECSGRLAGLTKVPAKVIR